MTYLTLFSQRQNCVHDPWSLSLERIAVAWLNPKLDNILINEWEQSGCTTYDIKIRGRPLRVKCSGCAGWGIWYINLAVSSKVEQNKLPKLHLDIRPSRDLESHNYYLLGLLLVIFHFSNYFMMSVILRNYCVCDFQV